MPGRAIHTLVIHCSATLNGVMLGNATRNCAQVIDGWHKQRGFSRSPTWRLHWNGYLAAIGYHFVIEANGLMYTGRHRQEIGAHAIGHNIDSMGICCVGYDKLTLPQWQQLKSIVLQLLSEHPAARVVGHRDLSPDLNHDGKITPNEYTKICPGFNAIDWWRAGMAPNPTHIVEPLP